jgi:hypothetical protein
MIENIVSECCEAEVYAYNKRFRAGTCSKCKEYNSAKELELELEN